MSTAAANPTEPHKPKLLHPSSIHVSPLLISIAGMELEAAFQTMESTEGGLSQREGDVRLLKVGRNSVADEKRFVKLRLLGKALVNPLVILLMLLGASSFVTGDVRAGCIIMLMVFIGVVLRFVQEARADFAATQLAKMISVHATVRRDGVPREIPIRELVPGDVIELSAGDMIPADIRLITTKDLFLTQSSLTGESFPIEKFAIREETKDKAPLDLKNVCFLGTSVESGSASGLVVSTGRTTYLGGMASAMVDDQPPTSFDRGMSQFTWLMIYFMMVMVPLVFLINGFSKGDWHQAFFFAMAIAVGMTPEMLPMIVAVCLSRGAMAMSRKKVIVKHLNSIQNLGAMDILCTDKTGTLTMDRILLEKHCDVALKEDDEVLAMAYLNSHFQTGLKSLMDRAILEHTEIHSHPKFPEYAKVDEIPFDFSRRMMSVVVKTPSNAHRLICKGAPEEVFKRCGQYLLDGELHPMDDVLHADLKKEFDRLSSDGFRVLAIAYRDLESKPAYSKADESELILRGFAAFLDPPKDSARNAIAALRQHGIAVKVLTGDNELVSRKICKEVGIETLNVLTGIEVEGMSDAELTVAATRATLLARLSPAHKQRIIRVLQSANHVVGFMGDGINDAPALRASDVGISVDNAADIAKESADIILLEKDLLVLKDGLLDGRKVFANILKYIRMGASSNFGNMFSVVGASIVLPFMPMVPIQILMNNLLYDFSQLPIPTDNVDAEQIAKPKPWSMSAISRFILLIGPCSSIFDYTTFAIMLYVFGCWEPSRAALFQTGWFVESLLTQTLIIHIIRTNKVPFLQSWASWPLIVTTAVIMLIGVSLPYSSLGGLLGFVPLPSLYWPLVILTLTCYVVLTQLVKVWLLRHAWVTE
jgi:P-type Mg2+ transporter